MDDGGLGFDARLGRAFGFDAADLEANRAGTLSDQQALILGNAARVQGRQARRSRVAVGVGFVLAFAVLGVGIALTPGGEGGIAALVAPSSSSGSAYVGRVRFGIDTLQWDAVRDGARYRLHHYPLDGDTAPLSLERV